jgi:hypothetical protein
VGSHERAGGERAHRVGRRGRVLRHEGRPRRERGGVDGERGSDEDAAGICEQARRGDPRRRRARARHARLMEPVRDDGRPISAGCEAFLQLLEGRVLGGCVARGSAVRCAARAQPTPAARCAASALTAQPLLLRPFGARRHPCPPQLRAA